MLKEKLINSTRVSLAKFFLVCGGLVTFTISFQLSLPLYLASFGGVTGQYFVVFWSSTLFNVFFWPLVWYRIYTGKITNRMRNYKNHWKLILIGVFDGLAAILIVYSSALGRTPGALQAILGQTQIPFSMFFTWVIFKQTYSSDQLFGAILAILGLLVSLIPLLSNFEVDSFRFYWPLLYLLGNIPLVLMNIFEESVFRDILDFDNIYLLAWESLYQTLTVLFLFWTDVIPGFGTSSSLSEWGQRILDGLTCFWNPNQAKSENCYYCFFTGSMFATAYSFSYIYGAKMMKIASANSTAIVSALSPGFCIFFWITFTGLNEWAGGESYKKLDIICYMISLPIIFVGIRNYRIAETLKHRQEIEEMKSPLINKEATGIELMSF